jgi:hypothetical protein
MMKKECSFLNAIRPQVYGFSGLVQKVHELFFRQHLYAKRLSFGELGTCTGAGHEQRSLFADSGRDFSTFFLNSLRCLKPRKSFQGPGKNKRLT